MEGCLGGKDDVGNGICQDITGFKSAKYVGCCTDIDLIEVEVNKKATISSTASYGPTANGLLGGGRYFGQGAKFGTSWYIVLDELTEYKRATLDHLREPLRSGQITISKSNYRKSIAAVYIDSCNESLSLWKLWNIRRGVSVFYLDIQKYRARLSGPFLKA